MTEASLPLLQNILSAESLLEESALLSPAALREPPGPPWDHSTLNGSRLKIR